MFTTSNINQGYQPRAHATQDQHVRKLKGHLLRSWFPERLPELDEPDETQWQFQDLSYLYVLVLLPRSFCHSFYVVFFQIQMMNHQFQK